jgi:hypothetical protein
VDEWAEWRQVQAVMRECAKGNVVFHRFDLAVADKHVPPPPEPEEAK